MMFWISKTLRKAVWAPILVFVFYVVAAKAFDAYLIAPYLDIPTHFFGGAAIAYLFVAAIEYGRAVVGSIPTLIRSSLAVGLTTVVAVVWELLEYGSDLLFNTEMNLGVRDTLSDLFFGLCGAVAMVSFTFWLQARSDGVSRNDPTSA
jgi:hypothetical protein